MTAIKNLNDKLTLDKNLIATMLLCLVITLGTALRIYDLNAESYWGDEVTMIEVGQNLEWIFYEVLDGRPPLYVLLAHFWMKIFGTTETATRFLSALAGIAAIAVMYIVGRELFGRKAGLIAALLMAISVFQITWSQTNRYYALFVLMTLFSYLFYIRFLKSRSISDLLLYSVTTVLLYYTHTAALFTIIAQGLYFLLYWNRYKDIRGQWLLSQTLILVGLGPGLLIVESHFLGLLLGEYVGTNNGASSLIVPLASPQSVNSHYVSQMGGAFSPIRHLTDVPLWEPIQTLRMFLRSRWFLIQTTLSIGAVFFVCGTLFFVVRQGKARWLVSLRDLVTNLSGFSSKQTELVLLGLWLVCPLIILLIFSKIFGPLYNHHYTIGASPALYLLLAFGITAVGKVVPELISIGLLVIVMMPDIPHYYARPIRAQAREAAAYVEENAEPGDVLVFAEGHNSSTRRTFYWYYQGQDLRECETDGQFEDNEAIVAALARCTSGSKRIWLITSSLEPEDIKNVEAFFFNPDDKFVRLIREQHYYRKSVYLFELH